MAHMTEQHDQYQSGSSSPFEGIVAADQEAETSSIGNPGTRTSAGVEDHHEKKSLMSKVKDKAKSKVHKLKSKLKKDKDSGDTVDDGASDEDDDWEGSDPQTMDKIASRTETTNGQAQDNFGVHSGRADAFPSVGDQPQQGEYDDFLRSAGIGSGTNSEMTSVSTDYSSPRASVDAVMPSPVIEPSSASELGEQSSNSLGEIPEAPKEEAKAVATEAPQMHNSSSSSFEGPTDRGVDETPGKPSHSRQEDMDAIERDSMSQELGEEAKESKFTDTKQSSWMETSLSENKDQSPGQSRGKNRESFTKEVDRELPSDDAVIPQSPADEKAVSSRGSDKGSDRPLRDPDVELPIPERAEFTDSMFSSADADDLRDHESSTRDIPNQEDQSNSTQGLGKPSMSGRGYEVEEGEKETSNTSALISDRETGDKEVAEGEAEQFHEPPTKFDDAHSERETEESDFNPESTPEYKEQKEKFTQKANSDLEDTLEKASAVTKGSELEGGGDNKGGMTSSITSALGSVFGTVGNKVGYYPTETGEGSLPPKSGNQEQAWTQWSTEHSKPMSYNREPITPQNSTAEFDSSNSDPQENEGWISKAVGALYGQKGNKSSSGERKLKSDSDQSAGKETHDYEEEEAFVQ